MEGQRKMTQDIKAAQRHWLSPSEALSRFKPPRALNIETPSILTARIRFGFRIGDIGLLIGPNTTSEVQTQPPIYALPNTPSWLLGLINLRGNLVPVFDLNSLLETGKSAPTKPMLLVLDKGSAMVGILINGLPQTVCLARKLRNMPPLPAALKGYVQEAYARDKVLWLEFDHHSFFQSLANQIAT
jgi:twitching motility protein PilI